MPYLVVENGSQRGLEVEVLPGSPLVLGRDSENGIPVDDHRCSRRHFEVVSDGDGFLVRDLGSSNGTFLNDHRVQEARLTHGDCLQAGETQVTFLEDAHRGARGLVGKTVGGYRILERIGRGGMGTVYKANQTSLNRTVALKILSPRVSQNPGFVSKFQREAQAAGRLNHPNIVQVYDVGSEGGLHFYSMEYIENGSVQDLATREGVVDTDLALAIVIDAARGLEYAEKKGLVHRDIKPDNLMVNSEGVVKIADLGLARDDGRSRGPSEAGSRLEEEEEEGIFGTPHFISPEQAQGLPVDTRSDIYSLGATFYRLVTGETPFRGDDIAEIVSKQIREAPVPVREKNRKVPAAVAAIVDRMMQKDPADRYPSAAELLGALEHVTTGARGIGQKGLWVGVGVLALAVGAFFALREPAPVKPPEPPVVTPTVTGPSPAEMEAERLKAEAQREALRVLHLIQLEDAQLLGEQRNGENLGRLATKLQDFLRDFGDAATPKDRSDGEALLESVQAEQQAWTQRQTEVAQSRQQADEEAQAEVTRILAAAGIATDAQDFAEATRILLGGIGSERLAPFPARVQQIRDRIQEVLSAATRVATADREAAAALAQKGSFAEAIRLLEDRATRLETGLDADPRLDPIRFAAKALRQDAAQTRDDREAKLAADRAADQDLGPAARRAAFAALQTQFAPDDALLTLKNASQRVKTAPWQKLLAEDLRLVEGCVAVRAGFLERLNTQPPDPEKDRILIPQDREGVREIPWGLKSADENGFTVERGRGRFSEVHPFSSYSGPNLFERVFSLRSSTDDASIHREARMLLVCGAPQAALARLKDSAAPDPDLVARIRREADAAALLSQIRELEGRVQADPMLHLSLMPLIDRFVKEFRETIAFALASDGSTVIFPK